MQWVPFGTCVADGRVAVNGLAWFAENAPHVWRLPARLKSVVRPEVWRLATHPAGGRLRFRTSSTALGVRVSYPDSAGHYNMSLIGQMGIDLYTDGHYARSVAPPTISAPQAGPFESVIVEGLEPAWREVALYLPNYNPIEILAIGVSDGAELGPPAPFAVEKPVAFYGSSITQGGCASRAGMSYQAIIGRKLGIDFVNLGFSGNGLGEPELAAAMAEIDASCYVLDFAQNLRDPEKVREVYGPFMRVIRERRRDAPMVAITPIYAAWQWLSADVRERFGGMRQVIRDAVGERIAAGDAHLQLIEGYTLLGPDLADGFADGVHPNDVGFQAMADHLAPVLAGILGLG